MSKRRPRPADSLAPEAGLVTRLSAHTGTLASRGGPPRTAATPPPVHTFFRPRWLAVHLIAVAVVAATVLLGRWQLDVSNSRHFDLQNFGYTLQYWTFAAFAIFFWCRIIRDARRPPVQPQEAGGQLVRPTGPVTTTAVSGYAGPADLVARSADGTPLVYRGYVIPRSAESPPVHSHGDRYHDSYNDYLWQLGLADLERTDGKATSAQISGSPVVPSLDAATAGADHPDPHETKLRTPNPAPPEPPATSATDIDTG
jgi:DNA-binding transcriptional regulator of glucitol operon